MIKVEPAPGHPYVYIYIYIYTYICMYMIGGESAPVSRCSSVTTVIKECLSATTLSLSEGKWSTHLRQPGAVAHACANNSRIFSCCSGLQSHHNETPELCNGVHVQ